MANISLPLTPSLAGGIVAAPLPSIAWITGLACAAGLVFLLARQWRAGDNRPHLRLVPTANAWGYSEQAQFDESAVGL